MHPLPLVSQTRGGSRWRHLDTGASQHLSLTWGLLRKVPQFVSSGFQGSCFRDAESPPWAVPWKAKGTFRV